MAPRGGEDGRNLLFRNTVHFSQCCFVGLRHFLGRLEPVLKEELGGHVGDARNGAQREPRTARFVLRFRLTAHLKVPAGQPRSEADVLPLLPDGERELIVGHHDLHGMRIFVHDDLGDARGGHGADDELGRIRRPVDDVDLLAAQLLNDALHARTFHPDAGADGIDVVIMRDHRDLRPPTWFPSGALHFDDALVDLRHLLLEQLDQEAGVGARQHDLRTFAAHLDIENEGADAVALPVALARNLLLLGQNRVRAAEIDDDILLLEPLHDSGVRQFAFAVLELVVDDVTFGVAQTLDQVLLRRLSSDTAVRLGQLLEQLVTQLRFRIEILPGVGERDLQFAIRHLLDDRENLEELNLADLGVVLRFDAHVAADDLFGSGQHRVLHRLHDDRSIDAFLLTDLFDDSRQLLLHRSPRLGMFQPPLRFRGKVVLVVRLRNVVEGDEQVTGGGANHDAALFDRVQRADELALAV